MTIEWKVVKLGDAPAYVVWDDGDDLDIVYAPFHQRLMSFKPHLRHLHKNEMERGLERLADLQNPVFTLSQILPRGDAERERSTVHLSIGLSLNCSMRCVYCHANAGTGSTPISDELLSRSVDFLFEDSLQKKVKKILVTFSAGGEPTFHWKKFQNIVQRIRDKERESGIATIIQMTTNGYYGDQYRKFIVERLDQVTLSFDGKREVQGRQRPSRNGQDTFHRVLSTAKYFYHRQFPFGIRSTVTRDSAGSLCDFVRFVASEIGTVPIAFECIVPLGRALPDIALSKSDEYAVDLTSFVDAFWEAFLLGERLGIPISTSSINLKKIVPTMCGAMSLPSLTITADGKVTGCHRDNAGAYSYGVIAANGMPELEDEKVLAVQLLAEPPASCDACYCRYSCGGDCPDLRIQGLNRCSQTRELTFRALRHTVSRDAPTNVGGLTW